MIKVLIVEDERRTARALAQLVEQHPDFTVVGTEANGADALVFLGSKAVDLVITDIRMPVMNGMELLKLLRLRFPQCTAVVLSGYSEFEYAKAAIQYQAFDYLLKPINRSDLSHLLDRAAAHIRLQTYTRTQAQLQAVLDGEAIPETSQKYHAALIWQQNWEQSEQARRLSHQFQGRCHLFSGSDEWERLLLIPEAAEVPELLAAYFRQAQEQAPATLHLILADHPVALSQLQATAAQLRMHLAQSAHLFQSELLVVDPTHVQPSRESRSLRELKPERAVDAINAQNGEDLRNCLSQVLIPGVCRSDVQNYLDTIISDSRIAYAISPGKLSQTKAALSQILIRSQTPEDCLQALSVQLLSLLREPTAKRPIAAVVEEIVQHMEANYHTPISVEGLAKQYNFVPRYLNKVFKDYKGVRPMEYLLTLRMDRAKAMLRANPDALVKDVANSVGYSDPLYFSRIFKRETGLWPSEVQDAAE